jgi:hypothetical protein
MRKSQIINDNKSKIKRYRRFFLLREGKLSVFDLNLAEDDTIFNITSMVSPKLSRNTIFEGALSHEYGKLLFGSWVDAWK